MAQPNGDTLPPPTFQTTVHEITVSAEKDSKVTGVTLYSVRAEVTREVKFTVETGQNKVTVTGLPTWLDEASLRVDGRGAGTIQGVTVSNTPPLPIQSTSDIIVALKEKRAETEAAIERCKRNRNAVYKYLETLNAEHVDATKLTAIMSASEENLERLDKRMADLSKQLDASKSEEEEERARLNPPVNKQLTKQVEVGLFADREGEVALVLKYALTSSAANWDAAYDVRVNTQTKDKPVKLVYQANIRQATGENWDNVPMLLETNAPTFGVDLPNLRIWSLEVKEKLREVREKKAKRAVFGRAQFEYSTPAAEGTKAREAEENSDEDMGFGLFGDYGPPPPAMAPAVVSVHNKGAVSTTYKIPGLVSIPSDGQKHTITIVELELDAVLSWVTVPKLDARTHLQARIKNTSEYILLSGDAAIYVDGTFNSKSVLPLTRPQETFDFSLGLDPAIRITYHPRIEKSSQSGLINKTSTKVSTQRITIQNTKLTPISMLKVIEGIPVSKDSRINIKLKNPDLALPGFASTIQRTISISGAGSIRSGAGGSANASSTAKGDNAPKKAVPNPTKISDKVYAQWHTADDENVEVDALGQDGRINWIVSELGSMEVVNLVLSWEVGVPEGVEVLNV